MHGKEEGGDSTALINRGAERSLEDPSEDSLKDDDPYSAGDMKNELGIQHSWCYDVWTTKQTDTSNRSNVRVLLLLPILVYDMPFFHYFPSDSESWYPVTLVSIVRELGISAIEFELPCNI